MAGTAELPRKRRVGAESSETRLHIVEAAEKVIREEGYAAASTRRVAAVAGLKPSLVHYYFPTTDDLFMAVFHRGAAHSDAMIETALSSDDPLGELWRFFSDTSRTALSLEFMALANHRKNIRNEIALHSENMRRRQVEAFQQLFGQNITEKYGCPAEGLSVLLAGIGRALVMEGALGVSSGHDAARAVVEQWIAHLQSGKPSSSTDA